MLLLTRLKRINWALTTITRYFSSATSSSASPTSPPILVLHPSIPGPKSSRIGDEYLLEEACALAETLGYEVFHKEIIKLRKIHPKSYIGKGKIGEIKGIASYANAQSVFINVPSLSAVQQKSLSELLLVPSVKDRMTVILEIFAQRARTREAKLQVELAQYRYALSHLIKSGSSYDQQRGGMGAMMGGGEKALELRRRIIRDHIKDLQDKLKVVKKRREEQRRHRTQPTVGLVGYTNVGKSSLLNSMTGSSSVSVQDQLFHTLDTTTRALYLPSQESSCLLIDTVGFISQLPHDLVAAFRATLEEVISSDVLLHVRDASTIGTSLFESQKMSVNKVLGEIGTPEHLNANTIEVWNKVDMIKGLDEDDEAMIDYERALEEAKEEGREVVIVSAHTGEGLKALNRAIADRLEKAGTLTKRTTFSTTREEKQIIEEGSVI